MKWYLFIVWNFLVLSTAKGQNSSLSPNNNKLIHFIPTSFSNSFSSNIPAVLTINSGDTVFTETIDAMGRDKSGLKRQRGGNPLTGPFYVVNANQGD
jgi:hypothetical protein